MKKFLLTTAAIVAAFGTANAADMRARPAAPAPYVAPFSWSGFYIGVHGGHAWKETETRILTQAGAGPFAFPIGHINENEASGFLGGGQIGFNVQTGMWVWGIEADISAAGVRGRSTFESPVFANILTSAELRQDWLATATGRVGIAFDRMLYYVKGGAAWSEFENSNQTSRIAGPGAIGITQRQHGEETRVGWLVGFGTEIAGPANYSNWSLKIESVYIDYGSEHVNRTVTFGPNTGDVVHRDVKAHESVTKVGINYRFGGYGAGPVYAKY